MVIKKRVRLGAALAAVAVAMSACGGVASSSGEEGATSNLRGSNLLPPDNSSSDLFQWFMDEVSERTDGAVTTEVVFGGGLLAGDDTIPGLQQGRAEAGNVVPAYFPADLPLHNINMVPLPGASQAARFRAFQYLDTEVDAFRDELAENELVLIGWFPNASQSIAVSEPVTSLADLQGLKIRVPAAPASAVFEELGVEPVFIPSEEVYESVERGIVDGVTYPLDVQVSNGVIEVAKYMVPDVGQSGGSFLAMSQSAYDGLSDDAQADVDDLRDAWSEQAEELLISYEAQACEAFQAADGTVSMWSDADQAKIDEIATRVGPEVWKEEAMATSGLSREEVDELWDTYVAAVEDFSVDSDYEDGLEACAEQQ